MRFAKDGSGKAKFKPAEWRTAKQIKSFFSRLAADQRKKPSDQAKQPGEEDQADDDEEDWEREDALALMRQSVYKDINIPHPLEYRGEDICDLQRRGKLHSKFKIKDLEDICRHFDLRVEGPKNRKASFVSSISELVQCCSCSKK